MAPGFFIDVAVRGNSPPLPPTRIAAPPPWSSSSSLRRAAGAWPARGAAPPPRPACYRCLLELTTTASKAPLHAAGPSHCRVQSGIGASGSELPEWITQPRPRTAVSSYTVAVSGDSRVRLAAERGPPSRRPRQSTARPSPSFPPRSGQIWSELDNDGREGPCRKEGLRELDHSGNSGKLEHSGNSGELDHRRKDGEEDDRQGPPVCEM
ncbi:hypothetical protein U9M48_016109 [Paspalum notatum var. saurae]|uniref:Uncharacterized protein n=1 Tax=Paspalum notatum var. saurae TaxID=547442 RepID=A0AAQ3T4T8_PASNO